jgi:hypothetical protein
MELEAYYLKATLISFVFTAASATAQSVSLSIVSGCLDTAVARSAAKFRCNLVLSTEILHWLLDHLVYRVNSNHK